ncbi:MAG: carboxypeptidase regulatory-like domain-containing protein [Deltaproteobacteria bacterium]|nr:carboxypeptidase regulatory-like domain-containing protein [Deltaproteobacteria bacterium]
MLPRATSFLVISAIACGGSGQQQPLYGAGTEKDEGHGVLARASAKLMTGDEDEAEGLAPRRAARPTYDDGVGGDGYGGTMYGGGTYGGQSYASYVAPQWSYPSVNRTPSYTQKPGLASAIEGTISWRGATPKLTSGCGAIKPLDVSAEHTIAGVLVYIERVSIGRMLPHSSGEQRPATVGGIVVKRGCAFVPTVQVVTPVPASLAIHGDSKRSRVRITASGGAATFSDLHEGGRVALQALLGVTRIESADGMLGAAWVVAVDTPYYAITDDHGRFRIDELAPGTYDVIIWQPPVPTVNGGLLGYGAPVIVKKSVKVGTGTARLDVTLGR